VGIESENILCFICFSNKAPLGSMVEKTLGDLWERPLKILFKGNESTKKDIMGVKSINVLVVKIMRFYI
jgi:hypothetical protein